MALALAAGFGLSAEDALLDAGRWAHGQPILSARIASDADATNRGICAILLATPRLTSGAFSVAAIARATSVTMLPNPCHSRHCTARVGATVQLEHAHVLVSCADITRMSGQELIACTAWKGAIAVVMGTAVAAVREARPPARGQKRFEPGCRPWPGVGQSV